MFATCRRIIASFLLLAFFSSPFLFPQETKARLQRKDSFFGLHFDLHPAEEDRDLGRDLTEEMVENLLNQVQPDYVQYDCKGHPGYLGYPSKVGTSSPGIVKDSLEVWRKVTARHGISLFIHFSGAWDSLAVRQNPEWAAIGATGKPSDRVTSTFGPYVDRLMIPELKEATAKYDLDGAWVDGECWAVVPDYSTASVEAFRAATGLRTLPKKSDESGWQAFLNVNREQFRRYVKHYVEAIHSFRPGFQIASNWLYTTFVPERPEIPVDFLSGDFLGNASVSTARLESRYLSSVGKPWDLMAWGFQYSENSPLAVNHKSSVQLCQEAAVAIAQGGGFQVYYQPTRSGRIDSRQMQVMSALARFCRARQALTHRTETVPQIGVLFSQHSLYKTSPRLFGGWGSATDPVRGMLDALVGNQYPVDVIPDWMLPEVKSKYPLIVVPDWPETGTEVKDQLVEYVDRGGRLLIVGAENAQLFSSALNVTLKGSKEVESYVLGDEVFGNVHGKWVELDPRNSRVLGRRYGTFDASAPVKDGMCAATVSPRGSGQLAAIYGPIGSIYASKHAPAVRQFIRHVVDEIFRPMIRLEGPPTVEMILRKMGKRLVVHLLNSTGMQVADDYAVTDFVPKVGPLRLTITLPEQPSRVKLEPGGMALQGNWQNKEWSGIIDSLEVHQIVTFEF